MTTARQRKNSLYIESAIAHMEHVAKELDTNGIKFTSDQEKRILAAADALHTTLAWRRMLRSLHADTVVPPMEMTAAQLRALVEEKGRPDVEQTLRYLTHGEGDNG